MDTNDNGVMVAATILQQIGGKRAMMMIGGTPYLTHDRLEFSWKCRANMGANYGKVFYDRGLDLYNMELGRVRKGEFVSTAEFEGLYDDQLKPAFEQATGLYLSL
jgi:hypothetical protein